MKYFALSSALLLAAVAPLKAQTATTTADSSAPTITVTTPTINSSVNVILTGTATDTGSAATGTTAATGGIQAVYYQVEGSSKWSKCQLTAKGSTSTTWIVTAKIKGTTGKRYYFRAVDTSGNESDVIGRRFRHGS